jgi:hypothetical protein
MIAWDGAAWRILAPTNKEPFELLRLLFHEADHVRTGDILREPLDDWPARRAIMRGEYTPPRRQQGLRAEAKASVGTEAGRQKEQEHDTWAYRKAAGWWPTLKSWQDPVKAASVVWWVHRELEKQSKTGE